MPKGSMIYITDIRYNTDSFKVNINLSSYNERFAQAQLWLGNKILSDTKPLMPIKTGKMQSLAHIEDGGRKVVYAGVYTRFQYFEKVMVDPVTLSPWARRGVKKILTDRPLHYASPTATSFWIDVAKERYENQWIMGARRIVLRMRNGRRY